MQRDSESPTPSSLPTALNHRSYIASQTLNWRWTCKYVRLTPWNRFCFSSLQNYFLLFHVSRAYIHMNRAISLQRLLSNLLVVFVMYAKSVSQVAIIFAVAPKLVLNIVLDPKIRTPNSAISFDNSLLSHNDPVIDPVDTADESQELLEPDAPNDSDDTESIVHDSDIPTTLLANTAIGPSDSTAAQSMSSGPSSPVSSEEADDPISGSDCVDSINISKRGLNWNPFHWSLPSFPWERNFCPFIDTSSPNREPPPPPVPKRKPKGPSHNPTYIETGTIPLINGGSNYGGQRSCRDTHPPRLKTLICGGPTVPVGIIPAQIVQYCFTCTLNKRFHSDCISHCTHPPSNHNAHHLTLISIHEINVFVHNHRLEWSRYRHERAYRYRSYILSRKPTYRGETLVLLQQKREYFLSPSFHFLPLYPFQPPNFAKHTHNHTSPSTYFSRTPPSDAYDWRARERASSLQNKGSIASVFFKMISTYPIYPNPDYKCDRRHGEERPARVYTGLMSSCWWEWNQRRRNDGIRRYYEGWFQERRGKMGLSLRPNAGQK